ncbi:ABC transporter substrate-binding protein [Motilimonas eburnea]|uniref:ABC transporter substrate-binding protein n=1 Tax=Motilimonas eburnea TaxID=1737488 RepID=UPI001E547CD6|nr:ABC transporter substrate-binding protein [Motilimonas eburnea]MCE2573354.1 ABC transporter substrate-binding protein [Motilimonas eburnea]
MSKDRLNKWQISFNDLFTLVAILAILPGYIASFNLAHAMGTPAEPQPKVLFINPGHADESFWHDVDLFMQEAARQFDIPLTTYHAERNPYLMIKKVQELIKQDQVPDYLILVNEDNAAKRMISMLSHYPVRIVLLLNDINEESKQVLFSSPQGPTLVASLIPDNHSIGFQTATELLNKGKESPSADNQILILSGNKNTPASQLREWGARQAITLQTKTQLLQIIYANWNEQQAYEKTKLLLQRHPKLRYVWAANDLMAFGAMRAAREAGLTPGKDIFFSAVNTSEKVLAARREGSISSLGGGHFMAGGWAMVLIKEDMAGTTIPKQINQPMFHLLKPKSRLFPILESKDWQKIDFTQFQKQPYHFAID